MSKGGSLKDYVAKMGIKKDYSRIHTGTWEIRRTLISVDYVTRMLVSIANRP